MIGFVIINRTQLTNANSEDTVITGSDHIFFFIFNYLYENLPIFNQIFFTF